MKKINRKTLMLLVLVLSVSEFVLGLGLSLSQFEENGVVGIHFGTTHFSVGVSRVEIIPLDQGKKSIPSWITFNNKWEPVVGREAKEQAALNPDNTIFNTQFFIGRKFVDPEVQRYIKSMPYKVVNKRGFPYIQLVDQPEARFTTMEDITTILLGTVKLSAERYLNKKIIDAVITVPAYFSDAQKEVTRNLGESVGINVSRIISEPTAVAISYAIDKKPQKPQIILVYNLGALTFDVSIFSIDNGVLKVLSTSGDTHLGGEDFDGRLLDYFINIIRRKYRKRIRKGSREMELLRRECENAKQALTRQQHVQLEIDSLFEDVDFSEVLTRDKFQILTLDLAEKTLRLVKKALEIAGLRKYEIDEILLVGSDARIPVLQDALSSFFDGKTPNKDFNPDEVFAYGAAVQVRKETKGIELVPYYTCLSLGVATSYGLMGTILPRNVGFPVKRSLILSTDKDDSTSMIIKVYEGERRLVKDCFEIGKLELIGIPPAPKGVPKIEVTMEYDINSILHVKAEDKGSKRWQSITISMKNKCVYPEYYERIVRQAEEMADEDRKAEKRIIARMSLEMYINSIMSAMDDKDMLTDSINSEDKEKMKKTMKKTLEWLDENQNAEEYDIHNKQNEVVAEWNPIIRQVYESLGDYDEDEDGQVV